MAQVWKSDRDNNILLAKPNYTTSFLFISLPLFSLPSYLFPCHYVYSAGLHWLSIHPAPENTFSINHLYNSLQIKPTLLPLNDIWRLSATTWPLFLQGPIVPTSINKPTSVTPSPTITPTFQRRATTEFLNEAGSFLTITFLMLLVNGGSSKNSPAGLLASCYSHSSIPTFINILNPLL